MAPNMMRFMADQCSAIVVDGKTKMKKNMKPVDCGYRVIHHRRTTHTTTMVYANKNDAMEM